MEIEAKKLETLNVADVVMTTGSERLDAEIAMWVLIIGFIISIS
jgi:hypothetical protein